jgi:hypothetical protein
MNIEKFKANIQVPFIQFDLSDFSNYKQEIIDIIKKEAVKNNFENLSEGIRTPWYIIKYDAIKWLADQITNVIGQYDKGKEGSLICNDIWGIIYQGNNNHRKHNHYPATWSAVAYIDCEEGSGETVWPDIGKKVKPCNGNVCIFPGYLDHYVEPSVNAIKRIIISCNIVNNWRTQ